MGCTCGKCECGQRPASVHDTVLLVGESDHATFTDELGNPRGMFVENRRAVILGIGKHAWKYDREGTLGYVREAICRAMDRT